jgi:2'-5' RNA ligase
VPELKRRLFVGIALDQVSRTKCCAVAGALRATGFAARYEGGDKLHVTLAFLGNVAASHYDSIGESLAQSARGCAPLTLQLDKIGAFPNERRPRVVYIGSRAQGPAYRALASGVRSAYARLGFSFKEDPVAHVTIARAKEASRPLPLLEVTPIALAVTAISLFESIFDPKAKTSRYEILERAPVGGTSEA